MKRVLWLVLVCLLTAALASSSCTQNVQEAPPKTETTTTAPPTPEPKPASFSVSGLTITPGEVTTGSSVTIEVLVTNTGELSGTYDVILKIDETAEATEKVTLNGSASQKVTFTMTKFSARTYLVNIDGQTGSFIVKSPPPSPVAQPPPPPLPPLDTFQKGMNFADWRSFDAPVPVRPPHFEPFDTERSLKNLAATGANWVALVIRGGQETVQSTDIFYKPPATATDQDIRRAIDIAHAQGMRVMLKPHVHLAHDPNHNHIEIGTAFTTEEQWQAWFASYRQFIIHYATLARDAGADMFLIGQELASTTHREDDWRRIAREVRQIYKGPIIYEAVHSLPPFGPPFGEEQRITWWDAVDYIGVEGYYPLTQKNNPTVEELKSAWVGRGWLVLLENLSKKYQKPIVISEIGYLSKDGTNTNPANFQKFAQAPVDLQEQADCYQAALEVLWGKPWLAGIYWWDWLVGPAATLSFDGNYVTPQGKPAEEVVKRFYLAKQ